MDDHRPKSRLTCVMNAIIWLGLVVLVLLALMVTAGRLLTPQIIVLKPKIEKQLSDLLHEPVHIGSMEAYWTGLMPTIKMQSVKIGKAAQRLTMDQIVLEPDVLSTLLHFDLRVNYLEVSDLNLFLSQQTDGSWQAQGLSSDGESSNTWQQTYDNLMMFEQLTLVNAHLHLTLKDQSVLTFSDINATWKSGFTGQSLALKFKDGTPKENVMHAEMQLNRRSFLQSKIEAYLSMLMSPLGPLIPKDMFKTWHLDHLNASTQTWLSWDQEIQSLHMNVLAPQIEVSQADTKLLQGRDISFITHGERDKGVLNLSLTDLRGSINQLPLKPLVIEAKQESNGTWQFLIDQLDLESLSQLALNSQLLSDETTRTLKGLKIRGDLTNAFIKWTPNKPLNDALAYSADINHIEINAYQGVPSLNGLDGWVSGQGSEGALHVKEDALTFQLPDQFSKPWVFESLSGDVFWKVDESAIQIQTPLLHIQNQQQNLALQMNLTLGQTEQVPSAMNLQLGVKNLLVSDAKSFIPNANVVGQGLSDWLNQALLQGEIEEGIFVFQGSLSGDATTQPEVGLVFNIDNTGLEYQKGWPPLQKAKGRVTYANERVDVVLDSARILNVDIDDATAQVISGKEGSHLAVDGNLVGPLEDVLLTLQQAPLGLVFMDDWSGQGLVTAKLHMGINLQGHQTPDIQVQFTPEQANLNLGKTNLVIENINGTFQFDISKGLSSQAFTARVLGSPVKGKVEAIGHNGFESAFLVEGGVEFQRLKDWLAIQMALPLHGVIDYRLKLVVGQVNHLEVQSDLQALNIDLPAPFGKVAGQKKSTLFAMQLTEPPVYQFLQDGVISAALELPKNMTQGRGKIEIGASSQDKIPSLPASKVLEVKGSLPTVNMDEWQAALSNPVPQDFRPQKVNQITLPITMPIKGQIHFGLITGMGIKEKNVTLELLTKPDYWVFGLNSHLSTGAVAIPTQSGSPILVNLDYLNIPSGNGDSKQDPLAKMNPGQLPKMDISIKQVNLQKQPMGTWKLRLDPEPNAVMATNISLGLAGMNFTGRVRWIKTPTGALTDVDGKIDGKNVADVLKNWKVEPILSSKRFQSIIKGQWKGSPAAPSQNSYSGNIEANFYDGSVEKAGSSAEALKIFGLLNVGGIIQHLNLNFSNLYAQGIGYNYFSGKFNANDGVFTTTHPLVLDGPSIKLMVDGTMDFPRDKVKADVQVQLPLAENISFAIIVAGSPIIGLGLYAIDQVFGDEIAKLYTVHYQLSGSAVKPTITWK